MNKISNRILALFFMFLTYSLCAYGQGAATNTIFGPNTPVRPNASVTVCTHPSTFSACPSNKVTIYSDLGLTTPTTNPTLTNAQGQFLFYVPSGTYDYIVTGPGITGNSVFTFTVGGGAGCTVGGSTGALQKNNGISGCSAAAIVDNGTTITASEPLIGAIPGTFTNIQMNENGQFIVNSCSPLTEYQASQGGTAYATEGLTDCVTMPSGSTAATVNGGADYINTSNISDDAVARLTSCRVLVNNGRCWSENTIAQDVAGLTTGVMLNQEADFFFRNGPSAYATAGYQIDLFGTGSSNTYPVNALNINATNGKWDGGIEISRGSVANRAFTVKPFGTATSGGNFNAPSIQHVNSVWNGSTAVDDIWSFQPQVGAGTNPTVNYEIQHPSGTSGPTNFGPQYPVNLELFATTGFGAIFQLYDNAVGANHSIIVPNDADSTICVSSLCDLKQNASPVNPAAGSDRLNFDTSDVFGPLTSTGASAGAKFGGLTLTNIASGTQCLHVNGTGIVSGTGSDCGSGGGSGVNVTVNGGPNLVSPANFQNGPVFQGLTINALNPSGSNVDFQLSGTATEALLPATTVFTDQSATFGAHAYSFAAGTSLVSPVGAGFAPTANGSFGYDSTANKYVFGVNGATKSFSIASTSACATHTFVNTPATATAVATCAQPTLADVAAGIAPTGTFDFSGVTRFNARVGAGLTTSGNGDIGYDSTNKNWHAWDNAADSYLFSGPVSGTYTNNDCVKISNSASTITLVDAGVACPSGASVTTTGTPASGNLTKFSGAATITNGDLSGDVTTSGTLATTLAAIQGTTVTFTSPALGQQLTFNSTPALVNTYPGVPVDTQSGASYTIKGDGTGSDRVSLLNTSNSTTSTAVTVPQAGSTGFGGNYAWAHCNTGTVIATDTPGTSTVNGNTTLKLVGQVAGNNPECSLWYSDNTNYFAAEILPTDTNGRLQAAGFPALTGDVSNAAGTLATTVSKVNGVSFPTTGSSFDALPILTASNTVGYYQINAGANCGDATHALAYTQSTHLFSCQSITGSAAPGGSNTQIQYNNAGSLGGMAEFTYATSTISASASGVLNLGSASTTTGFKIPTGAGAVPTSDGYLANNSTNHTLVFGSNANTLVGAVAATGTGTATTCSNQVVTAVSGVAAPTCSSLTLASAMFANQGTTTTVLHGNASGNPSFGAVANADLVNASTTVNGKTCTLGSTCGTPRTCVYGLGDWVNAITAATYPASGASLQCANNSGNTWNITALHCYTDNAGTSSVNVYNNAGTSLLTGAITCNATKTSGGAAGTQSATTTIANTDGINFAFTADGTSKGVTVTVDFTD